MKSWRLILDGPDLGSSNMAGDEAILATAERGLSSGRIPTPTLRFYEWDVPTISIGYPQEASPFLDAAVPLVRRITGGGAVLHHMELTYSLVSHTAHPFFSNGSRKAYSSISGAIVSALKDLGIEADIVTTKLDAGQRDVCFFFPSRYEVAVNGKKLVGSSQRRLKHAFLQHGFIVLDVDRGLIERVFGNEVLSRMTWANAHAEISKEALKKCIIKRIGERFQVDFEEAVLSDEETLLRQRLLEQRYLTKDWNMGHPLKYSVI
ncbi:MAG: lipoate--protein ligase family protein [Deltaproteobacteria bacterium]|nr:lipoate--protein ligase family protein [Deltaproteobacteria bacterium]